MKKLFQYIIGILPLLLAGCDVHEIPDIPEKVPVHLRLNYETDMTEWNHLYDGISVLEQGLGETYDNIRTRGEIRYIIRTYPLKGGRPQQEYTQEFVFTGDIADGYDREVTLDFLPGDYSIMVWSDIVRQSGASPYHHTASFVEIALQGTHRGNDDYRDAFRGTSNISLIADIIERTPDTLDVAMQRPLAKYEIITTDLDKFIDKEQTRAEAKAKSLSGASADASSRVNIDDYKVVFHYAGFMPCAYSLFTDKPVDSVTGVLFESKLNKLNEAEASVGFDYVFINGTKSVVSVRIGVYDNNDTQLSLSEPIEIPLMRSHHTILRGMFLMSEASGGVSINPDYDGDYILVFP